MPTCWAMPHLRPITGSMARYLSIIESTRSYVTVTCHLQAFSRPPTHSLNNPMRMLPLEAQSDRCLIWAPQLESWGKKILFSKDNLLETIPKVLNWIYLFETLLQVFRDFCSGEDHRWRRCSSWNISRIRKYPQFESL
jgi:hypothetical protein